MVRPLARRDLTVPMGTFVESAICALSDPEAYSRIESIANKKDIEAIGGEVISGDLTIENLGLTSQNYQQLISSITHILHAAASTQFDLPLSLARRHNVLTTQNLLTFAKQCKSLLDFGFISTAYIAGKRSGEINENDFEHMAGFLNTYEKSKYEAEALVRTDIGKLPITIFRPSLVLTPYIKGQNTPIHAVTFCLLLAAKGLVPLLPGSEESRLDIISGESSAKAIVQILLNNKKSFASSSWRATRWRPPAS